LYSDKKDITGFILSGGKSSRMGTNKALLKINNNTLIEFLTKLLEPIFSRVVISSNEPELFKFLGKEVIADRYFGLGPLSGIHSALSFTNSENNFIISCDLPFISEELIKYLIGNKSNSSIFLPRAEGRIQQLCGIYSKSVLAEVEDLMLESQKPNTNLKGSIFELLERVKTEFVNVDNLSFYHPNLFLNINNVEEYEIAKRILEQK
jgi:molybdopterin-guanine dinucleotide biosynthesis protein A